MPALAPRHAFLVALLLLLPIACAAPPAGPPDILLVSIDTLRHDHLECYGYTRPTSPTIDRLASEGARFDNAVSTTSWTLPAHAAMFTGLYDSTHGVVDNDLRLSEAHVTLAEVLRENGYQTAGFFGGPFLHPTFGLAQGFDVYQSCMTKLADDLPEETVREQSRAPRAAAHADITGPRTLQEIVRWLAQVRKDPFFLFVHLWDVHYDYIPPPEYTAIFDPDYEGTLTGIDIMHNDDVRADMPARDLRHLIALYDAEIRFTDEILARILAALDERGRLSKTLIVITSDHGEEFFEHGDKGHSRTLFDEVIRVPLIIRLPGRIAPGRVIEDQARLIDLMPTLLSFAGARAPSILQGRDLAPLMRGEPMPPVSALSELHVDGLSLRALRTHAFKLLDPGHGSPVWGFDIRRDPRELRPLPAHVPEVRAAHDALVREVGRAIALRNRLGRAAPSIELDDEMMERLRSLGYIGDDP
jgi:arylsulfatase A-like enzyme